MVRLVLAAPVDDTVQTAGTVAKLGQRPKKLRRHSSLPLNKINSGYRNWSIGLGHLT